MLCIPHTPPPKPRPAVNSLFGGGGDDFDSDDENETIAAGKRVAAVMGAGAGAGDGRGAIEVVPSRSSSSGSPGSSSSASGNTAGVSDGQANNSNHKHRIKLTDALDMFHRILDLRSENRRAVTKRQTDSAPPAVTTVTAAEGVDLAVTGFGAGGKPLASPDEAANASPSVGEGYDGDSTACAVVDDDEVCMWEGLAVRAEDKSFRALFEGSQSPKKIFQGFPMCEAELLYMIRPVHRKRCTLFVTCASGGREMNIPQKRCTLKACRF